MTIHFIQFSRIRRSAQRVLHMFAWAALLGMTLLALMQHSVVRASIQPPFTPDVTISKPPFSGFGFSVAPAGDVNGDDVDDFLVGAYLGVGKVYLYAGSAGGVAQTDYFSATTNQNGDFFGYSVDGGGDFNGDDADDFLVGAPKAHTLTDTTPVGRVYVYHGSNVGAPTQALTLIGETADDQFGWSVAVAGDVNDDGYDDMIAGALQYKGSESDTGRAYLYYGGPGGIVPSTGVTLTGEQDLDNFGNAVDGAGDVNGDGYDDVVVGAWQNSDGATRAGKVYVFFGSATGLSPLNPFTLTGTEAHGQLGTSVSGVGDINGDGYDDIIVGAAHEAGAGRVYLLLGSATVPVTPAIVVDTGEASDDSFGFAVNRGGDLNGDGFADLLAGAYLHDTTVADAGKIYAYGGCVSGLLPGAIFSATGKTAPENYGHALAGIGDVNHDGVDDLAAAPKGGRVDVYYGVKEGGCQAQIEVALSLGQVGEAPLCSAGNELQVPVGTEINACYRIHNTGVVTLTQHDLADGIWGASLTGITAVIPPGGVYTHVVTHTISADASGLITWTAGMQPLPSGITLSATAGAAATVTVQIPEDVPPTIYLPLIQQ